jgi:hypothetical protein
MFQHKNKNSHIVLEHSTMAQAPPLQLLQTQLIIPNAVPDDDNLFI